MKSTHASAASLLRKDLKAAFPGVQFRVRSDYNSIRLYWSDGPTAKAVEDIAAKYEAGCFNGMTDCYEYNPNRDRSIPSVKYIFSQRELTPEAREKIKPRLPEYQRNDDLAIWREFAKTDFLTPQTQQA